ncbi:hypothetical protein ACFZBE_41075 [Streptomyces sp. NPDC008061]|uniref:hypothetical protein n=1 Tax=Streptomyces sp. NPDC008061 TaxID=3364805 RepID=UPI0036E5314F
MRKVLRHKFAPEASFRGCASRLVDTAAAQLGMNVMRRWFPHGKLPRHGHDCHGRATADLDEIEQILITKQAA